MDCPTTTEVRLGKINVGSIQTVLDPMFKFAGIDVSSAMLTHAIQLKPAQDNLQSFFYKRSEYKNVKKETEWRSDFAPTQYGYLKPEYEQDIKRLWNEIEEYKPKVIIAMGGVALWALCGLDKVGSYRGSFIETSNKKYKVMPTYSPVAVLKNYSFRPTVLSDLKKATNINKIDYIEREICIEPTYEEVKQFLSYCEKMNASYSPLSFDIETANDEITCIGFAPHKAKAMVVPFKKEDGKDFYNYLDFLYPDFEVIMLFTSNRYLWLIVSLLSFHLPEVSNSPIFSLLSLSFGSPVSQFSYFDPMLRG